MSKEFVNTLKKHRLTEKQKEAIQILKDKIDPHRMVINLRYGNGIGDRIYASIDMEYYTEFQSSELFEKNISAILINLLLESFEKSGHTRVLINIGLTNILVYTTSPFLGIDNAIEAGIKIFQRRSK